jgi:hypothetical protein
MIRIALILAALLPIGFANAADTNVTITTWSALPGNRAATNGIASLTRTADRFNITLSAKGLVAGHAYTLLVINFNNPGSCKKVDFTTCDFIADSAGLGGNPFVTPTIAYLTGGRADSNGEASFNGKLERGAVGLSGRQVIEGTGAYNMTGAVVQVLIRDMGVAGAGGVDPFDQISKIYSGCTGNGGTNACGPVQIVTFTP